MELEDTNLKKNLKKEASILLALTAIFTLSFITFTFLWWRQNLPLISPLDLIETLTHPLNKNNQKQQKIVFGFLPYWNLKYATQIPIKNLTHLAYFGISLEEDGSIKKYQNKGELEPGWNKLNSPDYEVLKRQVKILGKKNILVIRAMSNSLIKSIVNTPQNRHTAINEILQIYTQKQFGGLNIDFEPTGFLDKNTQDNFILFIKEISTQCKALNNCQITLDIYAKSAIERRLYNLKQLEPYTDRFIVMAYDFYARSSTIAGPVAPLVGICQTGKKQGCLDYDIQTSIANIGKIIPKNKLILGIPFYGYQWQTVNNKFLSNTHKDTGALATYRRIQQLLNDSTDASLTASWSSLSLSPYLIVKEKDNQISQIHYEDQNSLKLKLEFINNTNLKGIAIWALGYETPYQDLWQTINTNL